MSVTKKRKLADDDDALVHITINEDGTTAVDISPKLDIFPPIVLSTISAQVRERHTDEVNIAQSQSPHGPVTTCLFEVWTIRWDRRVLLPPLRTLVQQCRSQGTANLVAMRKFQTGILSEQEKDKVEWVRLTIQHDESNLYIPQCQKLRTGDIGWDFDYSGNISLIVHRQGPQEFSVSVEAIMENEEV